MAIRESSVRAWRGGNGSSRRVGRRVMMGGGVGGVPHVEIGDDTTLGAKTGVSKSISGGVWWGRVAEPAHEAKKQIIWVRNLGKLIARVRALEKKLGG